MNKKERLEKIRRLVTDYQIGTQEEAELMDKMINLQVIPGNTAFVKAQLIDTFADKIFSCLTDDSSILVIARSGSLAEEIFEQVKNW